MRDADDDIVHFIDRPLPVGPVKGSIDWARRFDHMQQHTGQHLLSTMFQERFALPTVSFHLGGEISTIDLRGPEPTDTILEGAERAANQIIFENRTVTIRYATAEQLAQIGVRKEVQRSGILRAIEIEVVDLQPCGGTHVEHTGEIGMLLARHYSKIRQDWRVEFLCGRRAERAARTDFGLLRRVADRLSCTPESAESAIECALSERDTHFKNLRATVQRLALAEAALLIPATPPGPDGIRVISGLVKEIHPEFLAAFATQLSKSEKTVALLARQECGHLIFAQHPSAGKDMTALLKQALDQVGGKGGGSRAFARGRLNDAAKAEAALAIAKQLLSAE